VRENLFPFKKIKLSQDSKKGQVHHLHLAAGAIADGQIHSLSYTWKTIAA
jgi:hypothetical protein